MKRPIELTQDLLSPSETPPPVSRTTLSTPGPTTPPLPPLGASPALYPFQKRGVEWLVKQRYALLADEPGLGKTAQFVKATDLLKLNKILIICPASAQMIWIREYAKFSERDLNVVSQVQFKKKLDLELVMNLATVFNDKPLVIIGSFQWATSSSVLLRAASGKWDVLGIDEVHMAKNPHAARTRALFGKEGLCHSASRVWCLSGSPAPNHAAELWVMLKCFGKTSLSYTAFVTHFCHSYQFKRYVAPQITGTRIERIVEIRNLLSGFMLRRKAVDVLKELPPISYNDLPVVADPAVLKNMSPETIKKLEQEYELVCKKLNFPLADTIDISMSALEALAQSVSTLRRYCGLQKVKPVCDILIQELAGYTTKVVIFAIHKDVIAEIARRLDQFNPVVFTGSTPMHERHTLVDTFQTNPKCRVFIGSSAAYTALTLTAANQVVLLEYSWVPEENIQAAKRCHRIGQKLPVFARFAALQDSIDDRVSLALRRKAHEISQFID